MEGIWRTRTLIGSATHTADVRLDKKPGQLGWAWGNKARI
jgi:hypothetical protein